MTNRTTNFNSGFRNRSIDFNSPTFVQGNSSASLVHIGGRPGTAIGSSFTRASLHFRK